LRIARGRVAVGEDDQLVFRARIVCLLRDEIRLCLSDDLRVIGSLAAGRRQALAACAGIAGGIREIVL